MRTKSIYNLALLFCLISFPFGIWGITASGITPFLDRVISFLYGFSNGLLFASIWLILTLFNKKLFLWLIYLLNAVSYSIALFTVFYYIKFNFPFSSSSLIVLLETNKQEASEFITSFSTLGIILFVMIFMVIQFLIVKFTSTYLRIVFEVPNNLVAIFLFFIISIYTTCIIKNDLLFQDNMFFALRDTNRQYKEEKILLSQLRSEIHEKKLEVNLTRPVNSKNETYILVLGESLSKYHMSLYGYTRETNPELEKLKDELLVFTDVISSDNTTVQCIKKILTFANCEDMKALYTKPGLIQLLNIAGFETYWISNQSYSGTHDSWTTLFSLDAKEKYYTNFVNGIKSTPVHDEVVLEPLQTVLTKPAKKKFIFVHLIGSHKRADFRYPYAFSKFSSYSDQPLTFKQAGNAEKTYVNYYDNSVLYNDFVLSEIIHMVQKLEQKSFVFYFPDHGEEVCEESNFSGHSNGVNSRYMTEIPMILWCSELFKRDNKIDCSVVNRPYQTDDVIHSVLDLLEIKCSDYIQEKSIFHPCFQIEKRIVEGRYDYDMLFGNGKSQN